MTSQVINPFTRFVNKSTGRPIFNGEVYFGEVATDPKNNVSSRIPVYMVQNDGTELLLSQPIETGPAGYLVYNGTPIQVKVTADPTENAYCIQVFDDQGVRQFYCAEVNTMLDFPTLADPASGVVIAGVPATTLADLVNNPKVRTLDTYDDLRGYDGNDAVIILKGRDTATDGLGGVFVLESETGATDNGGTRLVDAEGRGWYLQHNGTVNIKQFGFVADFTWTLNDGINSTGTGTDNTAFLQAMFDDDRISVILGEPGDYWFGEVTPNQYKTTCERPVTIDWAGAELFCTISNVTTPSTSASLIEFLNVDKITMSNFGFTQINFDALYAGGAGNRGVNPFIFHQTSGGGVLSAGCSVGDYIVHKGQSLVAAASDTKAVDRLEGLTVFGTVTGKEVYYGFNLFYSGHNTRGSIVLNEYIRSFIMNDVVDCDINILQKGDLAIATSSSGILNCNGDSAFACRNNHIKGVYDQINGPFRFSGPDSVGALAVLDKNSIDVYVEDFGSNLSKTNGNVVSFAAYDGTGAYVETGNITLTDNTVKIRTGIELELLNDAFYAQTVSPNNLRNNIDAPRFDVSSAKNKTIHYKSPWGLAIGHRGNLFTDPLQVSIKKFLGRNLGPQPFYVAVDAVITKASTAQNWTQRFILYASMNSDGTETVTTAAKVYEAGSGAYKPTLSFTASGSAYITVTCPTGEADADGRLTLLFSPSAASMSAAN